MIIGRFRGDYLEPVKFYLCRGIIKVALDNGVVVQLIGQTSALTVDTFLRKNETVAFWVKGLERQVNLVGDHVMVMTIKMSPFTRDYFFIHPF